MPSDFALTDATIVATLHAAKDTVASIRSRHMAAGNQLGGGSSEAGVQHLEEALAEAMKSGSLAKISRWLGYVQGVAVAKGWLTQEECQQINCEWKL